MKFKIGQKVTPKDKHWEVVFGSMKPSDLLEFGKVYTVMGYPLHGRLVGYFANMVQLEERPGNLLYHEDKLEPLIEDSELEGELESIYDIDLKREHLIDG